MRLGVMSFMVLAGDMAGSLLDVMMFCNGGGVSR